MKKAPGTAHYQLGYSLLRQHLCEERIAHIYLPCSEIDLLHHSAAILYFVQLCSLGRDLHLRIDPCGLHEVATKELLVAGLSSCQACVASPPHACLYNGFMHSCISCRRWLVDFLYPDPSQSDKQASSN